MFPLILIIFISTINALDPEVHMTAPHIIQYWKYPFEEYTTITDDGYVLTLYRIRHGRNTNCNTIGIPFILAHGLGASAEHFVLNPPESSPAFILADAGFDVWLINFRGSKNSRKHLRHKVDSSEFWNFSWDEMAQYDLPSIINKVIRVNGHDRVYYAGHSQGTLVLFAKLSTDPSFSSKIIRFFALAPISATKHIRGPINALYYLYPLLQKWEEWFGSREFVLPTQQMAGMLARWFCSYSQWGGMCEKFVTLQGGPTTPGVFNQSRTPVYYSHYPGSGSLKNFVHWGQMIGKDKIYMFDYGSPERNQINYGLAHPPFYNFSSINHHNIHLFYSSNDYLATSEDIELNMMNNLSPSCIQDMIKNVSIESKSHPFTDTSLCSMPHYEAHKIPGYSHNDFVAGTNVKKMIFDPIINIIRRKDGWKNECKIEEKKKKKMKYIRTDYEIDW